MDCTDPGAVTERRYAAELNGWQNEAAQARESVRELEAQVRALMIENNELAALMRRSELVVAHATVAIRRHNEFLDSLRLFALASGRLMLTRESEVKMVDLVLERNGFAAVLTPTFPSFTLNVRSEPRSPESPEARNEAGPKISGPEG